MPKQARIEKQNDGSYWLLQGDGSVIEKNIPNKKEAQAKMAAYNDTPTHDKTTTEAAGEPDAAELAEGGLNAVSEFNPFGLDIHERFARLLVTLRKMGIRHHEDPGTSPQQNPATTGDKFARAAVSGMNSTPDPKAE